MTNDNKTQQTITIIREVAAQRGDEDLADMADHLAEGAAAITPVALAIGFDHIACRLIGSERAEELGEIAGAIFRALGTEPGLEGSEEPPLPEVLATFTALWEARAERLASRDIGRAERYARELRALGAVRFPPLPERRAREPRPGEVRAPLLGLHRDWTRARAEALRERPDLRGDVIRAVAWVGLAIETLSGAAVVRLADLLLAEGAF